MGYDLQTTLVAITPWGDPWPHKPSGVPIEFIECASSEEIAEVSIHTKKGRKLEPSDMAIIAGLGATEETRKRLRLLHITREQHNER